MDAKIFNNGLTTQTSNERTPKYKCSSNLTANNSPKDEHHCCQQKNASIVNPFENCNTLDYLHQPSFSPSVFKSSDQLDGSEVCPKTPQSFWTIDQIAILKPADIDVSQLHQQQDSMRLDHGSEIRAQKAIDEFFTSHINVTSPSPHYLAIISPSVGFSKKAKQNSTSFSSPQFQDECCENRHARSSRPNNMFTKRSSTNEVGTQTALSIPWEVNMDELLKKYSIQTQSDTSYAESLTTSSLRRKLFFYENADDTDESEWYPCLSDPEPENPKQDEESSFLFGHRHLSACNTNQPFIVQDLSPHASPIYPVQKVFRSSQLCDEHRISQDVSVLQDSPCSSKCICGGSHVYAKDPDVSPILPTESTKTNVQLESTIATMSPFTKKHVDDVDVT